MKADKARNSRSGRHESRLVELFALARIDPAKSVGHGFKSRPPHHSSSVGSVAWANSCNRGRRVGPDCTRWPISEGGGDFDVSQCHRAAPEGYGWQHASRRRSRAGRVERTVAVGARIGKEPRDRPVQGRARHPDGGRRLSGRRADRSPRSSSTPPTSVLPWPLEVARAMGEARRPAPDSECAKPHAAPAPSSTYSLDCPGASSERWPSTTTVIGGAPLLSTAMVSSVCESSSRSCCDR